MVRTRLVFLGLAVALVAAACGGTSDAVAPFADIAEEGPTVVPDSSGVAAVLTVATTIDAVCAVAYGIGEPSGQIATDQDMGSGGHRQHQVVLSALEPDTKYSYRLQGVGADGRLYRSEVFTFRTPEAAESPLGPNLAQGATVVEASSEFSASFAAGNAVDGDPATEWSSAGDGDDAFIIIDLGDEAQVGAVAFRTRQMADGSATTNTFSVTADDEETLGPFPAGPDPVEVDLGGQILRFDVVESTGGNTGAVDIEVYPAQGSS